MKPNHNELGVKLQHLTDTVESGFLAINDHLAKLNGQTAKNTEWRLRTEGGLSTLKWILGFVGASNIALLAKVLFL